MKTQAHTIEKRPVVPDGGGIMQHFALFQTLLIEAINETSKVSIRRGVEKRLHPKPIGGGWYQLPDGSKIQGKEKAELVESLCLWRKGPSNIIYSKPTKGLILTRDDFEQEKAARKKNGWGLGYCKGSYSAYLESVLIRDLEVLYCSDRENGTPPEERDFKKRCVNKRMVPHMLRAWPLAMGDLGHELIRTRQQKERRQTTDNQSASKGKKLIGRPTTAKPRRQLLRCYVKDKKWKKKDISRNRWLLKPMFIQLDKKPVLLPPSRQYEQFSDYVDLFDKANNEKESGVYEDAALAFDSLITLLKRDLSPR